MPRKSAYIRKTETPQHEQRDKEVQGRGDYLEASRRASSSSISRACD